MGVYCDVNVCIKAEGPLSAELRGQLVELAVRHELLFGLCVFGVPRPVAPPPSAGLWARFLRAVGLGPAPARVRTFGDEGLAAYAGVRESELVAVVEQGEPGPWLEKRAKEASEAFVVSGSLPKWAGKTQDGGFIYLASREPVEVRVANAYEPPRPKSSRAPDRDYVGSFYDVLTLSSRHDLDGRVMSRSAFVKDVKAATGGKVTCRASWW